MSYGLTKLESGDVREIWEFVLIGRIGCKTESSWGKYCGWYVHLVCDNEIIGGYHGTRTNRGWRGYSIRHMIIALMEMVGFKSSLSFEVWIEIQGSRRMGLVVLKVSTNDIDWSVNQKKKVFV